MFFTDFFMGTVSPFIIQLILWNSIFSSQTGKINSFSFNDIIYYYAFALMLSRMNNGYDMIRTLSGHIRKGELEVWLTKPFHYLAQRFFTFFGESILYTIPVLVLFFIRHLSFLEAEKADVSFLYTLLAVIMIIIISQLLCFLLSFCLSLLCFWVIEYNILLSFSIFSSALLGGVLLPPSFWPDWLMPLMKYNPYHFTISAPAEYMTTYAESVFLHFLIGGIFYIFVFFLIIRIVWFKGMNVYNGAGG
ncbi:ABC transporter permease [Brenneria rubrifaciens]|uniref:ABC transporter permease n=2 Tax=Brenneria rubrifaciens TaxID=55213 RepID=A0A4P8QUQ9_9GAMM|nr:ABC transporter permease [Brenneria rubrifaciens]